MKVTSSRWEGTLGEKVDVERKLDLTRDYRWRIISEFILLLHD